jgi:hypothetical protein
MVSAKLLNEQPGVQYIYTLPQHTLELVEQARLTHGPHMEEMERFRELAIRLLSTEIWHLELGSTILYFLGDGDNWNEAMAQACSFKGVKPEDPRSVPALAFAKEFARPVAA